MDTRVQLKPPKVCDSCKSDRIGVTSNSVVYGIERGAWPYCYYCDDCGAMVGCHPNTHNPLGLMATSAIRRKRKQLHELFDPVWRENYLSRDDAYRWLGSQLNIEVECHIGNLTKEQLIVAISLMRAHKETDYKLFRRRKAKADAKHYERTNRENSRIVIRKFVRNGNS